MNIDTIRTFIQVEILNDTSVGIEPDDDLLLNGLVDSLGATRLVQFIESKTGITVPPEDFTLENFSSIASIMAYLTQRMATA